MATTYKVLAQNAPATATATDIYTCPASTQTVISTIMIANTTSAAATYRIAIRPNAETLSAKHYIAYDATVGANDSVALTLGATVDAADVVTVYTNTGGVSVSMFGTEIA